MGGKKKGKKVGGVWVMESYHDQELNWDLTTAFWRKLHHKDKNRIPMRVAFRLQDSQESNI